MSLQLTFIVIAHELGHLLLHRSYLKVAGKLFDNDLFNVTGKAEKEANLFAAFLLLDKDEVLEQLREGYTIDRVAANMNVIPELVCLFLLELSKMGEIEQPDIALPASGFLGTASDCKPYIRALERWSEYGSLTNEPKKGMGAETDSQIPSTPLTECWRVLD